MHGLDSDDDNFEEGPGQHSRRDPAQSVGGDAPAPPREAGREPDVGGDRGTLATSATLLDDARSGSNDAWLRFVSLYRPLIRHWLKLNGVAEGDLDDMEQDLLLVLFKRLAGWTYDRSRGSFRGYVKTIVRNAVSKYHHDGQRRRQLGLGGVGGTDHEEVVRGHGKSVRGERVDPEENDDQFDTEFHRRAFEIAREQVRGEVDAKTWAIFEQVDLLHRPVATVAAEFAERTGNVYVIRSRVRARLRRRIEEMDV
jgi:RNA polymerase sigma factor (sigma-70 family)